MAMIMIVVLASRYVHILHVYNFAFYVFIGF
jgi:hypothetical protein